MKSLKHFLSNHLPTDKKVYTHTRIGDKSLGVYGGVYNISLEDTPMFHKLYHKSVFVDKKFEFLTEAQYKEAGVILIDLDLKYKSDIDERQHTETHIVDILQVYLKHIAALMKVKDKTEFPIWVLEKPHMNTSLPHITKDGIHVVIGIHMPRVLQMMLRERVLTDIQEVFQDLELENDIDNVVDISVTRGGLWQMYGSRKPGHEAYQLVYYYNAEYENNEWSALDVVDISQINQLELIGKISARNNSHIVYEVSDEAISEYTKRKNSIKNKKVRKPLVSMDAGFYQTIDYSKVNNKEQLDELQKNFIGALTTKDHKLKETHQFTMILSEKYYNNYDEWLRVGFALHNTDPRLFLSWLYFSSQSDKFNFDDIPSHWSMWKNMRDDGVTDRSIMYWARECNPAEYDKIRKETIDYFIEDSVGRKTDHSMALVLYNMFKGQYVCASIKHKTWFEFENHKWIEIDSGTTLREKISTSLAGVFSKKMWLIKEALTSGEIETQEQQAQNSKLATLLSLAQKMGNVDGKNKIMREAQELFYDRDFMDKLDANPYLLHFKNGIFDFHEKVFRDGRSDDYISLSTNHNYVAFETENPSHVQHAKEINLFFEHVFVDNELRRYMWEHLASTLIGTNENETFNIYNGCGRNGKSKIVDFMSKVLGQLKGVVPISLVTRKRGESGKASPEIAALRGIRYAVMQEPSKNDKINEGQMKELTGGDTIQARALFKDPIEFKPQFKLVVCTNNLFDIESNDDGTWRRIRVCEFLSKFKKKPSEDPKDREFKGIHPTKLLSKFDEWLPVFTSMLIDKCLKTMGVVEDCEMVLRASNKYRGSQDYLGKFFLEAIKKDDGGVLTLSHAYGSFSEWYTNMGYGRKVPKRPELRGQLEKKLGIYPKGGWRGYKLRDPDY